MLKLVVPESEDFNESNNEFIKFDEVVMELEHSLVSLSKWESIHEKPFLTDAEKTKEETLSYIEAMVITPNIPSETFSRLNADHLNAVNNYIKAKMTATWFADVKHQPSPNKPVITSEVIYYWMISLNIPFECERWHLNRLITLVQVCNEKNKAPDKKKKPMTQNDLARRQALNAERRAKMKTSG